jgi:dTDP-4-amino-4,6-dideoxygalactose transaminase
MNVPLLDLKLQYKQIQNEVNEALIRVAESQMLILGPEVDKLEKSLADYCNTKYAIAVSSGTDALLAALMALDIKAGDEVICPTYSFFATAGVIVRVGATPVFVDSREKDFNINPDLIEKAITKNTKAIIPVHLYGQSAEMDEILKIANKHNIPVIEDCAQAIGAQYKNGEPVGSMGIMGCFSFYPTKNLGAFGEGGFVTTNDESTFIKLKQMRNHGMEPKYYHNFVGGNFRLDAIQAAVLNIKFPLLDSWHQGRRKNAALYEKYAIEFGLTEKAGITKFDDKNKVLLPNAIYQEFGHNNHHIYNQFIIRVENRDEMRNFLAKNSIGSEIYYPVPFHRQGCFAFLNNNDADFPIANLFAAQTIALPIFPELEEEQIKYVCQIMAEFFKN